jgi:hypothetical protein
MIMHYSIVTRNLFILFLFVSISSCMGSKKARVRQAINNSKELLKQESKQISATTEKKELSLQQEKIDTTINNRINERLNKFKRGMDSIDNEIVFLEKKLTKPKEFRKEYKGIITSKVILLENYNNQSYLRIYKMKMVNEAIEIADKKLYELAAFFGPGKYIIPEDKFDIAAVAFNPLVDSLVFFANKYDSIQSTATLVVNGFADGMGYTNESETYQILLTYLKKTTASKEELNQAISELRAQEISKLIEVILQKKGTGFKAADKIKFHFYGYGQGETFPTKTITDYQTDDERRRIVLIYWIVLPD